MGLWGIRPYALAAAMLLEQIVGSGHLFHAARDDQFDAAGGERLGAHDDGLHARPADLVDGRRLHRLGQAGLYRGLPRRRLAKSGGQHTAHIDALDVIALARSEEHTSELQSLMRISYAVFCMKITKKMTHHTPV